MSDEVAYPASLEELQALASNLIAARERVDEAKLAFEAARKHWQLMMSLEENDETYYGQFARQDQANSEALDVFLGSFKLRPKR